MVQSGGQGAKDWLDPLRRGNLLPRTASTAAQHMAQQIARCMPSGMVIDELVRRWGFLWRGLV